MQLEACPFEKLGPEWKPWLEELYAVQQHAHAPYSKFKVGSVVVDAHGRGHSGCNFENASFNVGSCAERVAIGKMISAGEREISRVLVVTSTVEPFLPCGMCRQAINEFGPQAKILSINKNRTLFVQASLAELLPGSFTGRFQKG